MPNAHRHPRRSSSASRDRVRARRSAFTFVEVLFAIIILGIGMIMIAGVLPVAIKQNSDTRDELTGKAVAEAGFAYVRAAIQQNPNAFQPTVPPITDTAFDAGGDALMGATIGRVLPLNYDMVANGDPRLQAMSSLQASRINSSDSRFQWLAFYRRDADASSIRVIVMAMRLRNGEPVDRYGTTPANKNTLEKEQLNKGNGPFLVRCKIEDGGIEPDRIIFTGSNSGTDDFDTQVAASNAFVIVNHSPSVNTDTRRPSRNNGRVFRLAQRRGDLDATKGGRVWELAPGYDLAAAGSGPDGIFGTDDDVADASMASNEVTAWMVGRGRLDPAADVDTLTFGGLPQDVLVVSADVPIN